MWGITLSAMEELVALDDVEGAIAGISTEGLAAEDLKAVEAFRKAMSRRRKGKPDYGVGITRDDDDEWV